MARFITLLVLFLFISSSAAYAQQNVQLAPAIYVFGDSTVDAGNGFNHISRFNTTANFIATFLGLPRAPPYKKMSETQRSETKTGINYGYVGVGILPQTNYETGKDKTYWSFDIQIKNFNETVAKYLPRIFTSQELSQHLSKSIFMISFGINDYTFNYLPPRNGTLSKLEPDIFAQFLLNELLARIRALYELGARKFLVNNIWPLGCTPNYVNVSDPLADCCNQTINQLVLPYSQSLPLKLKDLQTNDLLNAVFSHSDNFQFVADVKENRSKYGITNTKDPCLNSHRVCQDINQHLYFDSIHTTEAADRVFAVNCFNGTLCSPKNIIGLLGS